MKIYGQYCTMDEKGTIEFDQFVFLRYFEENIQPTYECDGVKVYEGLRIYEFLKNNQDTIIHKFELIYNDKKLNKLQEELEAEGKEVCMFNLGILSLFIYERSKNRCLLLMKPKIKEILSSLNDVSKITFTNKDGSTIEGTSNILIDTILKTLEDKADSDSTHHEVEKVVTWDEFADKSVLQSYFVHDLAIFLNKYFPVKRKKDALVSTKEVELILYLMKWVSLSKVELTNKRYWQLMNIYEKINKEPAGIMTFNVNGKVDKFSLRFVPFSVWNKGKIDWTDDILPIFPLKEGDTFNF